MIERMNFNTIWGSLMSSFLIFVNEEWHLFVIDYAHFKSKISILYFIIIVLVMQLFLMKMFAALMINQFFRSASIKYLIKNNQDDQLFTWEYWKERIQKFFQKILSKTSSSKVNSIV